MNRLHSRPGLPSGIERISDIDLADEAGKNTAIARILETREVRQALSGILPAVLHVFAGDSRFGKLLMNLAGKYLNRRLSRPQDVFEENELRRLFEEERFVRNLGRPLPQILDGLFEAAVALMTTMEAMPGDEKKEIFSGIIKCLAAGQTGEILTRACRIINDLHRSDPEFFTRTLEPGFKKWIESVDFGEIREMVDHSAADGQAFIRMVNNVLWQYPAKMVLLLSLLPSLVNLVTDTLSVSVGKLNELPPDMLTDVTLSFVREIDSGKIADVLNQLTEIIRKIHTGSALLGEPGTPQLPRVLSTLIDEIIRQADPVTLWKARIALAETRAAASEAVAEAVNNRTDFRNLNMIMGPELTNIRLKSLNRRLSAWESVDDAELAKSITRNLSAYDVQELAEVANNTLRLLNRLGDTNPAVFVRLAEQLVSSIDTYALSESARHLFNGAGRELKPVARAVVPNLVTWICDVIAPADDEYEDDAARARSALRSLFAEEEV